MTVPHRVLLDMSKGVPDDPIAFEWEVLCREQCTVAFLVPSQLMQMTDLRQQGRGSAWRLRVIGSGGQPLRKKHMEAIGTITDCIHVGYGSTETGLISSKVRPSVTCLISRHPSPVTVRPPPSFFPVGVIVVD